MSKPKTTYTSQFPDKVYVPTLAQERSGQEGVHIQTALSQNNEPKIEIAALQGYVGPHPTVGWEIGDDTINERIVRLCGTGACAEEGDICNYDSIDPSGFIVQNTGILETHWVNPTGIAWTPPVPPVPAGAPPWPGPGGPPPPGPGLGGGGPDGDPVGPTDPYPPPTAPWRPDSPSTQPFGPWTNPTPGTDGGLEWNKLDFIQWILWKLDTSMLRHEWQSGETINIGPRTYTDYPEPITRLVELLESWPTSRVNPSALNPPRISLFDLLLPLSGIANFILGILGISVAVGTISGSTVIFTTPGNISGGTAGATAAEIGAILSNSSHASFNTSNITDVRVSPAGPTIVGGGVAGPAIYEILFSGALDTTSGTEVMVFYRSTLFHA